MFDFIVFAEQRGFHIAKTSSPDEYRGKDTKKLFFFFLMLTRFFFSLAANVILRLTAEGRILVSFKPPGFFTSTKYEKLKIIEADAQKTDESSSSFDEATSEEEEDFEEEIVDIKTGGSFAALMSDADA
jgi:hypothetical protein